MSSFMKLRNTFFRRPSSLLLLRHHSSPATPAAVSTDQLDPIDYKKLPSDYNPATFDPTEHRTPPSDRVWRLVDEVSLLTLQEVAELSGILMRKASISDPPIIAVMKPGAAFPASAAGAGAPAAEEAKPEKTVFELKLESFEASSKIKVIKEVRGFTTLGLKEAKELVERAPVLIKAGVSKEEGEQIIEKMKGAGAKVVME